MPETKEERPAAERRSLLWLLSAGGISLAGMIWLVFGVLGLDETRSLTMLGWEWLQAAPPIIFFSVVLIGSLLPIPVSVLYAAAGTLYGVSSTLLWIALTSLLANTIIYFICSSFLRPTLIRQVEQRGHAIPRVGSDGDATLLITLIRITPGIPYFIQNWILGLSGVSLFRSLAITLIIHMMYAAGFVILGRSAFEGELGRVILAVAVLVALSVVARIVHQRIRNARPDAPSTPDLEPR